MSETCTDYQVSIDERRLPGGVAFWPVAKNHIGETISIMAQQRARTSTGETMSGTSPYTMGADTKPTFIEVGEKYPDKNLVKIGIWGSSRKLFQTSHDVLDRDQTIVFIGKPYIFLPVCFAESRYVLRLREIVM